MPIKRGAAAAIAAVTLLLAATLGFVGCGADPLQTTSSGLPAASTRTVSGSSGTFTKPVPDLSTSTTLVDYDVMTTSGVFAARSRESMEAAMQLGDAVISYLRDGGDLGAVQSLVALSAQEGLAQMLSLLVAPTACQVWGTGGSGPFDEIEVDLVFTDGQSQQPDFTLTVVFAPDKMAIADIESDGVPGPYVRIDPGWSTGDGATAPGSSPPEIRIQAQPKFMFMNTDYAYYTAEAVSLATVVDVLPLRMNPLAGADENLPVVYKGYVLEVERAYGPETIPGRIIVYTLGNGTIALDGVTYDVRADFPLDARPGDTLLVPLMKTAYFGTPALKQDEYWVQANWATFAVDEVGNCIRATGADLDLESRSEFPLSDLEAIAQARGKAPSLVD